MDLTRYQRQVICPLIGEKGQEKLFSSSVLVVGCGGLGCTILSELVRAGVGKVRLVDRDIVSLPDLQRQILYDEEDVKNKLPKAKIAAEKLKKINSRVKIESFILEVNSENIKSLLKDADLVIDATDNIETRFIINRACVENKIPWIHGAVHGSIGISMNIIPGKTACYRCLIEASPPQEKPIPIINTLPITVASIQATEAFKILTQSPDVNTDLIYIDLWKGVFQKIKVKKRENCPVCGKTDKDSLSI